MSRTQPHGVVMQDRTISEEEERKIQEAYQRELELLELMSS